jgi:hypothetical protein
MEKFIPGQRTDPAASETVPNFAVQQVTLWRAAAGGQPVTSEGLAQAQKELLEEGTLVQKPDGSLGIREQEMPWASQ